MTFRKWILDFIKRVIIKFTTRIFSFLLSVFQFLINMLFSKLIIDYQSSIVFHWRNNHIQFDFIVFRHSNVISIDRFMRCLKIFVNIIQFLQNLFKSIKMNKNKINYIFFYIWQQFEKKIKWPQQINWILIKNMFIHLYIIYATLSDKNIFTKNIKFKWK